MSEQNDLSDAVAAILKGVETVGAPAISQKELVRRVLECANTGQPRGLPGARTMEVNGQTFVLISDELQQQCAELKKQLGILTRGDDLAGPTIKRLQHEAGRMVLVPTFEIEGGELHTKFRHLPLDLQAVLAHTLLSLRDRGKGTPGADVKRCALPGCGRFFLASDLVRDPSAAGRRRSRYCSGEHMLAGQTPGAERTAKWRKNQQAKTAARHK
jgi:hypothetical protein